MTSEYTRKDFLASQSDKLKTVFDDSDYILTESPSDVREQAAEGITTLWRQFPYTHHTFQFIKKDARSPVIVFDNAHEALTESLKKNEQGFDVYFMVNEGDAIRHEGKKTPRSQESVLTLSKFFIDTDGCPLIQVREYLDNLQLRPHLIVESSPGRYHMYFSFQPVEKTDENIVRWKAVQHMLARLGDVTVRSPAKQLGMDQTMHDYAKLLRVPGFVHVRKLCTTKIIEDNEHPLYDFNEFFTITNAQLWLDYVRDRNNNGEGVGHVPNLDSTDIIDPGERWQTLQSLSLHLANTTDRQTAISVYENFVRTRLNNEDQVYLKKDGELTYKARSLLTTALDKVVREQKITEAVMQATVITETQPTVSPWHLTDDFYLSAPNGFGDVVRQVLGFSMYPNAALSFGTFLTGLSILKSRTHLTPHGSSTALYTLCVAPSGFGKNDPMTILQNTFVSLGLGSLLSNEIRSDRGLYAHLAANQGTGFFLLDEVAPLLRTIQDKNANAHHANIAKALLSLYSSGAMKGLSLGKLAESGTKRGEKEIVIDNPMLGVLGFTVPSKFKEVFTAQSVCTGLFQRFIPIVPDVVNAPLNAGADKTGVVRSPLFTAVTPPGTEIDPVTGEPIEALQNEPRTRLKYTPDAYSLFVSIQSHYRRLLIEAGNDPDRSDLSGVYSRVAEQIERVASVLSVGDTIDISVLQYAQEFIESRHKAIMRLIDEGSLGASNEKAIQSKIQEDIITRNVARLCVLKGASYVSQRELYQSIRKSFDSWDRFDQAVKDAAEIGSIQLIRNFKQSGKGSKPITVLTVGEVLV